MTNDKKQQFILDIQQLAKIENRHEFAEMQKKMAEKWGIGLYLFKQKRREIAKEFKIKFKVKGGRPSKLGF